MRRWKAGRERASDRGRRRSESGKKQQNKTIAQITPSTLEREIFNENHVLSFMTGQASADIFFEVLFVLLLLLLMARLAWLIMRKEQKRRPP